MHDDDEKLILCFVVGVIIVFGLDYLLIGHSNAPYRDASTITVVVGGVVSGLIAAGVSLALLTAITRD